MSEEKGTSVRGRWDHLLREIPTQSTKQNIKKPKPPKPEPVKEQTDDDSIYKVSEINKAIKDQLEGKFSHLWLQGEISNFKAHSSGHFYFSLKDAKAQINAVMFRGFNGRLKFQPESGMEVLVRGKITVYEPRGNYQIFCEHMEPVGAGALQKAFEQLKAKLQKEGLFDESRKKQIPEFPKQIAVVTSPTGAAIQDILNVLGRRSRRAQVTVIPARVQGEGAASEIVKGIELANKLKGYDVLIVGRGGGSIEDLWCFNEEIVARAIATSEIPIISAVGHEVDFTIADFVSDLRAPTPSAAAEVVAQSEDQLLEKLRFFSKSLRLVMYQKLSELRDKNTHNTRRLINPKKIVEDSMMRLEDFRQRLELGIGRVFENRRLKINVLNQSIKSPREWIERNLQRLTGLKKILMMKTTTNVGKKRDLLTSKMGMLESLSPLRTIDRGYAIVREKGDLVADASSLKKNEIEIELRDGFIEAEVKKVNMKEES